MIEARMESGSTRRVRYGMVGGGSGALIGDVHRRAIGLDSLATLVAGCFSRDLANTLATGRSLGVDDSRCYPGFEAMAAAEGKREDGIDFVIIVTPNALHFPIARAFLESGIHVVCDKPLTLEVAEAEELEALAARKRLLFCVTYTYSGYPAVMQAREMIRRGEIGALRFINAEYLQEWLATPAERLGQKQAAWRSDPGQSGKSNCLGDIGSHIENLVSYVTGLEIESICARLDTFVQGRALDDNATVMLNYRGGAKGLYWSSQVAVGCENALRLRVFGSEGSIQWSQENPNYLVVSKLGKPTMTLSRGRDEFHPAASSQSRLPGGHPEGYFEAFANIYRAFIGAVSARIAGEETKSTEYDFPGVEAGVSGVRFVERAVESSRKGAIWLNY